MVLSEDPKKDESEYGDVSSFSLEIFYFLV